MVCYNTSRHRLQFVRAKITHFNQKVSQNYNDVVTNHDDFWGERPGCPLIVLAAALRSAAVGYRFHPCRAFEPTETSAHKKNAPVRRFLFIFDKLESWHLQIKSVIMKNLLLLFTLLTFEVVNAQAPELQWQHNYGGSGRDSGFGITPASDGGFVVVGQTKSNDHDVTDNHLRVGQTTDDIWVMKANSSGTIIWQKALGGTEGDTGFDITPTSDGGYIITGSTYSNDYDASDNSNGSGFIVIKLNSEGVTQWHRCYGGTGMEEAYSIRQTNDGGYVVCGQTNSINGDLEFTTPHQNDIWILKLYSNGDIQWNKRLGGSSNLENALSIKQISDGGYIVSCASGSNDFDISNNNGLQDFCLFRLDSNGTVIWQKSYGGSGQDVAYDIIETTNGDFVVTGNTTSSNLTGHHGLSDGIVMRINSLGEVLWQKILGGSLEDFLFKIRQTDDGDFVAIGQTNSSDGDISGLHGNQIDGWLVKLSASGELLWQKPMGGSFNDALYGLEIISGNKILVTGTSNSVDGDLTSNLGDQDLWIAKIDTTTLKTQNFEVLQITVAPNPSSKNIILSITEHETFDKIVISDNCGKTILIQNEKKNTINIETLQSGIYFIQASANGKIYTTRFIKN